MTFNLNFFISEYEWACTLQDEMKGRLLLCCKCYAVAIDTAQAINTDPRCEPILSLAKRHGNILNELGVWYMNQAQALLQKQGKWYANVCTVKTTLWNPRV